MATIKGRISEIRDYLTSALSIGWEGDAAYEDIIRSSVEGQAFNGERREINIAFIAALLAMPKAHEILHSRGIVIEKAHFGPRMSVFAGLCRFDLADSRFSLPLALRECTFAETLDLRRARLASLDLTRSTMPALMLQGARLDGCLFLDEIHVAFGKSVSGLSLADARQQFRALDRGIHDPNAPHAGIDANDLVTGDRVSIKKALVRGGIRLRHAQIGGDLVAKEAVIISRRYAKAVCLHSDTKCTRCLLNFPGNTRDKSKIGEPDKRLPIKLSSIEPGWNGLCKKLSCKDTIDPQLYNPDERAFDAVFLFEAHVKGTVELTDGFISIGEVSLNSTRIDGGLFCRGGRFFQHDGVALSMDGIKVGGSVYLDEYKDRAVPDDKRVPVPFEARGTVSMRGAIIEHRLDITKADFSMNVAGNNRPGRGADDECDKPLREREHYAFYAKRLRVAGDMFFNKVPDGRVNREEAHRIVGPICMENAHIGGRLLLAATPAGFSEAFSERPFLSLDFAQIEAATHLEVRPATASHPSHNQNEKPWISLRSARLGSLDVSECAHERLTWDLEGLDYDAVENVDRVTEDGHLWRARRPDPEWIEVWTDHILRKGATSAATMAVPLQPFDALMAFLREAGRDEAANRVGISKEKEITENIRRSRTAVGKGITSSASYNIIIQLLWRWIIRVLVGYGYRLERTVGLLLILVILGGFVFSYAQGERSGYKMFATKLAYYLVDVTTIEHGNPPHIPAIEPQEYPSLWPWLYSLELATPLPELGQESHFEIKSNVFLEWYKCLHIIFGWLLSFLIVLSPTRLLRRE